jgi:peptidoglycan/LPS O-acetylase OafA/YrhL
MRAIRDAAEGARFRSKALWWFGTISYGLYLVHQPIAGLCTELCSAADRMSPLRRRFF